MAKIYHHTSKLKHCCRRQRLYYVLCLLGIALSLFVAYLIAIPGRFANAAWLIAVVLAIAACILLAARFNKQHRILLSGVQGEQRAERLLKALPDSCNVITNPVLRLDGTTRELDFIVVCPSGICIVEVKNHKGRIEGSPIGDTWMQYKKGGRYYREIRNPLNQVYAQLQGIRNLLADRRISVPVRSVLFYANEDADVRISLRDHSPIALLSARADGEKALAAYITGGKSCIGSHLQENITHLLNRKAQ